MPKIIQIITIMLLATAVLAEEVTRAQIKGLDEQVQDIKKDVLELTTELTRLEEKLLFPSNTQVSLFVSLVEGADFRLDSVQLKLDEQVVAHHLYTFRELEALRSGGVQRAFTGNIKSGDHALVFSFIGKSNAGDEYSQSATYTVNKAVGPKFVEIKLAGPGSSESITFRDW